VRRVALPPPALVALPLLALLGLSAYLRTRGLGDSLWIDEGISVGIASHPAAEIPGLLRQDGSPPLYYLLLHGWIELAGSGEAALRAPSLVFALLTVPAVLWGGWSLFGRRAGWLCATLAALLPFLTAQAQETRMYSLVALLSVLTAAAFLHGFVRARRGFVLLFAFVLTLLLYTHYWTLFLVLGALAAFAALLAGAPREGRRRLAADGLLAFGLPLLAFAPWVPTLAFHLEHTGAPWSNPPPAVALAGAAALAAGAVVLPRLGRDEAERRALQALALAAAVTLAAGWASAHLEPGWASRYLAVLAGPLLLLAGAALARLGAVGIAAVAALCAVWAVGYSPAEKSNVAGASALVAARLEPGDLVVSTQPEQVPVLAHYLPNGLRYATPLGPVADPGVMDWRNALPRLERSPSEHALAPLLDSLPAGARVLLVAPAVGDGGRWRAPWTRLVVLRSEESEAVLGSDRRFRPLERVAPAADTSRTSVRLTLYAKTEAASSRGR
jgi:mannosyltransferase